MSLSAEAITEPGRLAATHLFARGVALVTDNRPGRENSVGVFDSLTGLCVQAPRALFAVGAVDRSEVDLCRAAEAALSGLGLIETGASPRNRIGELADHLLITPVHSPSLAVLEGASPRLYRPGRLSVCSLPRRGRPGPVRRDAIAPLAAALLRRADQRQTLGAIRDALGVADEALMQALLWLADPDRQMIRLAAGPAISDRRAQLHYPMQSFHWTGGRTGSAEHYDAETLDAGWNFDWLEPTIAHAFRYRNAALGGRSYGGALRDAAHRETALPQRARILEIGGGSGALAVGWAQRAQELGDAPPDWTILDRSPRLGAAQRAAMQAAGLAGRSCSGDAQRQLPGGPYDLILANEVLANFDITLGADGLLRQAGAHAVLGHCADALVPGGLAIFIEYGSRHQTPARVDHLGHQEYTVDFGDLAEHAQALGLEVSLRPLAGFLGFEPRPSLLVGQQEACQCLASWLEEEGRRFDYRAYDAGEFEAQFGDLIARGAVRGLHFAPAGEGLHYGPDPRQFFALLVKRPVEAGEAGANDG